MNAITASPAKVIRIAKIRPNCGSNIPQMTGATYANAVHTINVSEIAVLMERRSCWLCPNSGINALNGVQYAVIAK